MQNYNGQFITVRPINTLKPIIVVSKKISTKAVVRNKLRRQLKQLLRHHAVTSAIVRVISHPGEESFTLFGEDIKECLKIKR